MQYTGCSRPGRPQAGLSHLFHGPFTAGCLHDGSPSPGAEAATIMTTPCKVPCTALVVVGIKEILKTGKMHDETVSVS